MTSTGPLTIMNGFRAESTPMTTNLSDHENGPASLGARLKEQRQQNPAAPLMVLKKGLSTTPWFNAAINDTLERILVDAQGPVVLTALSNAVTDLNPFSGLATVSEETPGSGLLEGLVTLLGPGEVMEWHTWPEHFALFSAAAVEANGGRNNLIVSICGKLCIRN